MSMQARPRLKELLTHKVVLLDGAMGTELVKRGMPNGVSPELWGLQHPEIIEAVHREYCKAGADIIYTATFGANYFKLLEFGNTDVKTINYRLARLARKVAGSEVLVAGDLAPSGRFVEPFGELDFEEAVAKAKLQIEGLLEGGVDLFVIETMIDLQEARALLLAAKELSDAFTIVTMTFEKDGHTLNGTSPLAALVTLQSLGADAFGLNCSVGPYEMVEIIKSLKPYATVPLVAKPNAGLPQLKDGRTIFPMNAEEFSEYAVPLVEAGANLLGGCCGTTPQHIQQISDRVKALKPINPQRKSLAALSSAYEALILRDDDPLLIVGERINPTGKKALQEEIKQGKKDLVLRLALEQKQNKADLLDVNVGVPGIDEVGALTEIVKALSLKNSLPLVLDSANPKALEAALRIYPGRALLNSISLEKEKMEILLPCAKRYGAMVIVLPVASAELPKTALARLKLCKEFIAQAEAYGLSKEDLIADALTMTISANPQAALTTLETIRLYRQELGLRTIIGLSNLSFGLPERNLLNAFFLSQAVAAGLNLVIANVNEELILKARLASDLLAGKDLKATRFLAFFATKQKTDDERLKVGSEQEPGPALREAILAGDEGTIGSLVAKALGKGYQALELINQFIVPSLQQVGELFEKKIYFLPQLLASAKAAETAFKELAPALSQKTFDKKGLIVLATVEGDIHDLGKNIVALLLRNYGFEVIDLGKNVPATRIIEEAILHQADLIGLSALMTTTMERMREVINLARQKNLQKPFLVGGAAVTLEFAESIGAFYARDGIEAVKKASELLARQRS